MHDYAVFVSRVSVCSSSNFYGPKRSNRRLGIADSSEDIIESTVAIESGNLAISIAAEGVLVGHPNFGQHAIFVRKLSARQASGPYSSKRGKGRAIR